MDGTPPAQLTRDSGMTSEPVISRDGKLLSYTSDRAGQGAPTSGCNSSREVNRAASLTIQPMIMNRTFRPTEARSSFDLSAIRLESTRSRRLAAKQV